MPLLQTSTMFIMECSSFIDKCYIFNGEVYYSVLCPNPDDPEEVELTNTQAKQLCVCAPTILDTVITGRLSSNLVEMYLYPGYIMVPEESVCIAIKHVFVQSLCPDSHCFDLVTVDTENEIRSVHEIPRQDLAKCCQLSDQVFCTSGVIPTETLHQLQTVPYTEVCSVIQQKDEENDSDYVPESESSESESD